MNKVEIFVEVKESKDSALKKLKNLKSEGIKIIKDIYFQDPLRETLKPHSGEHLLKEVFRLRETKDKTQLTYKTNFFDQNGKWIYSQEHEIQMFNVEEAFKIITHLGLNILLKIENERHVFTNEEYEIVLEEVKDLGIFLEVEKLVQDEIQIDQIKIIKNEIQRFIDQLGIQVSEELNIGKPELMLKKIKRSE